MHNNDLLISQCLKSRYFPRSNFLKASIGYCPSYTWRSILQARVDIIEKVGIWRVEDGRLINVWEDNWLPYQNGHRIWSPEPLIVILCLLQISFTIIFDVGMLL